MPRLAVVALFVIGLPSLACGSPAPQPPTVTPSPGNDTIRGTERLGWNQLAGDNSELATIRYAIYVDGIRAELAGATCDDVASDLGYACSAPLPRLTSGNHALELAAFVQDGGVRESARSATLFVTVSATDSAVETASTAGPSRSTGGSPWPSAAVQITTGLDRPADLAVLPDGRLLVAERSGRVRVVRGDSIVATPALTIQSDVKGGESVLAVAVDPQFARTHFVFAIYTSRSSSGVLTFALARFREAGDTLADRVVLLDDVRASATPHASLRFGPDGKLYAAFDNAGDARLANDLSSSSGKLLRLNPDGTTPNDQPRGSPVLSTGLASPRGIDWHRASGRIWTADLARVGGLSWPTPPTAVASRDDDLYVASDAGVRRARIDRRSPDRIAEMSDVLRDVAVRAIAVAPNGRVYFATANAIGRIK